RRSAPELSRRQIGPACDQFSLALICLEMLIGCYPVGAPAQPSLDLLSEADRAVLGRALHPDPHQRWPSSLEMIAALQAPAPVGDTKALPGDLFSTLVAPNEDRKPTPPTPSAQGITRPNEGTPASLMQARFGTNLTSDVIRQRLEGFREQWKGEALISEPS